MRAILLFVLGLLVGACAQVAAVPPSAPSVSAQAAELEDKTVALTHRNDSGAARPYCSGVWVSERTILTAFHCIEDEGFLLNYVVRDDVFAPGELGERPTVIFRSAGIQALDPDHDLALLRAVAPLPLHGVARVGLGGIRTGARVSTMGHPLGLWWSFSSGDIAAVRYLEIDPAVIYVQTTAPTSRGNSGCGLFDSQGFLIGVAHAGIPAGSNLAFYVHGQYVDALLRRQGEGL